MQLVLCKNRVVAYGESCFFAMGGTVICEETGKAYANATIAECENIPCDIDRVGYEYRAGVFTPCAPYGMDNGEGYIMVACKECATPKNSGRALDDMLGARLNIAAEFGSQIVCYNNERTEYPKEISPGLWRIDLPAYGEWVVKATLGDITGEQIINVDVLKEYYAYFGFVINVEYPAGAVCTCSMSGTTLTAPNTSGAATFVVYSPGTWNINIKDGEKSVTCGAVVKGTENEVVKVKLNFDPEAKAVAELGVTYSEGIESISWADLSRYAKAISKSDIGKNVSSAYINDANTFRKISIGDTKTFSLKGATYTARVIGFNHDSVTNSNSYGSEKAGITFETVELCPDTTIWATAGQYPWADSTLRTAIMDAYATAETALRNVVVAVNKKYHTNLRDNFNGYEIALSSDTFFALSEIELKGAIEASKVVDGEQYALYAAGNEIKKKAKDSTYNNNYWTRSTASSAGYWVYITAYGSVSKDGSTGNCYFFGAFCI